MLHACLVPWYHIGSSLRVVKLRVLAISQAKYMGDIRAREL
jgi:hypothetical protein